MSLSLTSKQTTIKLGPHKGEEMYVMNVFVKPRAEAKLALIMPRQENDCCEETKVDHYSTVGAEKIVRRYLANRKWLNYKENLMKNLIIFG